jgi:hypothetical protein
MSEKQESGIRIQDSGKCRVYDAGELANRVDDVVWFRTASVMSAILN